MTNTSDLQITDGPFDPSWESLRQFQCPDWFRDAKLVALGAAVRAAVRRLVEKTVMRGTFLCG